MYRLVILMLVAVCCAYATANGKGGKDVVAVDVETPERTVSR